MDVQQLNRIARQVADALQRRDDRLLIQFAVWQRGIADPDASIATGRICVAGQRDHTFELSSIQVRELLSQSDDQAARTLESLLNDHVRQADG